VHWQFFGVYEAIIKNERKEGRERREGEEKRKERREGGRRIQWSGLSLLWLCSHLIEAFCTAICS